MMHEKATGTGDRYTTEACAALGDTIRDDPDALTARLDGLPVEDLRTLHHHAARLAQVARLAWMTRITTPTDGA